MSITDTLNSFTNDPHRAIEEILGSLKTQIYGREDLTDTEKEQLILNEGKAITAGFFLSYVRRMREKKPYRCAGCKNINCKRLIAP